MSAGSFVIGKYQANDGDTRPIRVQPETIAGTWNPDGTGTSSGFYVRVSGGKRQFGLKARSVTLKRNIGALIDGFQPTKSITLPVLTQAAWTALSPGTDVTYGGFTWEVTGRGEEGGR